MPAARTLLLVAGSGRSGTSLVSGVLQRLGCRVPAPEVPADASNPRGFAESQWVVDFHARLLASAGVQTADGRPAAWASTAREALTPDAREQVRNWLASQLDTSEIVLIKDPRLSWFVPLWRATGDELGLRTRFVTMLRHPAAVIESKDRWYSAAQTGPGRTAGWINQTLFTERATRESPRLFVQYEDLLADWTTAVARIQDDLGLDLTGRASAAALREIHGFVDRSLARSRPEWGQRALPAGLRELADETWSAISAVAAEGADAGAHERLDALRGAYTTLYQDAEATAQSSIAFASRRARPAAAVRRRPERVLRVLRVVPEPWRRAVPLHWRNGAVDLLARVGERRDGASARARP